MHWPSLPAAMALGAALGACTSGDIDPAAGDVEPAGDVSTPSGRPDTGAPDAVPEAPPPVWFEPGAGLHDGRGFVLVGFGDDRAPDSPGESVILRSEDGRRWHEVFRERRGGLVSVAAGDGVLLAAGTGLHHTAPPGRGFTKVSALLRSTDGGARWDDVNPDAFLPNSLAFAGDRFFLAGASPERRV